MLRDILRFNREAVQAAAHAGQTLGDYLKAGGYRAPFIEWYLLPMAAAIWSCPASRMLEFPLASFVGFCHNHGLLQVFDRPQWRTVKGGGREYVDRMTAAIGEVRLGAAVDSLRPLGSRIELLANGVPAVYDQVVLACHSDQSQAILAAHYPERAALLARMPYQPKVTHHRDYWDAAEELYARLPVLKWLMRALARQAAAKI